MALVVACANPRPMPPPGVTAEPSGAKATPAISTSATPSAVGVSLVDEVAREMDLPASRIELTIDPQLQRIVEEELGRLADEYRPAAATAIILDPAKGELLAIRDAATARRAFVTGSTMKTVTVAAALEAGAVRLEQKFDCRRRSFGAHTLEENQEWGQLDIREILEVSSNVGASRILDATGRDGFDATATRFHLGAASTVELPNMARGDVPKTAALDAYDAAMAAAGEKLAATPLQMATVYGVIANEGEYVAPTLVRKTLDETGRSVARRAPVRERVVRAETARTVMQLLERAVQGDHATGKRAKVEGVRIAGKTGTGGFTTPDGQHHVYSSFIGVLPADSPRYVILVGVADPREGAPGPVVAAPAFARIAARVLRGS
jgi:cell division protein FtsI (penicillin-binding protein 3)